MYNRAGMCLVCWEVNGQMPWCMASVRLSCKVVVKHGSVLGCRAWLLQVVLDISLASSLGCQEHSLLVRQQQLASAA